MGTTIINVSYATTICDRCGHKREYRNDTEASREASHADSNFWQEIGGNVRKGDPLGQPSWTLCGDCYKAFRGVFMGGA